MVRRKLPGAPIELMEPAALEFAIFTAAEIQKMSALEIRTSLIFDSIGQPLAAGLYDTILGPMEDRTEPCGTCKATLQTCPGHFAYIRLPLPVINPLFHKVIAQIIKLVCTHCYRSQVAGPVLYLVITQLKLLDAGYPADAEDAEQHLPFIDLRDDGSEPDNLDKMRLVREALDGYCNSVMQTGPNRSVCLEESKIVQSLRNNYVLRLMKEVLTKTKCQHCKQPLSKFSYTHNKLYMSSFEKETEEDTKSKPTRVKSIVLPDKARAILRNVWKNEPELILSFVPALRKMSVEEPTDLLFLEMITVIPPKARPVAMVDSKINVHPQTSNYIPIINNCILLRHLILLVRGEEEKNERVKALVSSVTGNTPTDKLHTTWQGLQADVDHLMDKELNNESAALMCMGLKQVIEKKAGCIRMNMMGKRVNFAARSVITPDPNLEVDEIGVPEKFALKLTYPTPVTAWNVAEMRRIILNGPLVHPGAVMVENEDGTMSKISGTDRVQRETIAKRLLTPGEVTAAAATAAANHNNNNNNNNNAANGKTRGVKIVHRHLHNGDVLLLNRQPTLHRPSIMAHKARILKGEKTLRLNYTNCKAYNADFDGDEMNAHFPQNELARSEAYTLVNVCNNYLVPKDGTPLSGLIQDHIVSGVRMTMRGRFFNRDDYQELVYIALASQFGDLLLLPPTILKPTPLWSGKQIISTVILNVIPKGRYPINLTASAKIGSKAWENAAQRPWKAGGTPFADQQTMSEAEVVIREGELLCGVLDKTHYGATPFGLVHCLYELYGGTCSSRLLSAFSKLFTAFLQLEGFTLGVEDILVLADAEAVRTGSIVEARTIGDAAVGRAFDLEEPTRDAMREKLEESLGADKAKWRALVDRAYKVSLDGYTNVINKACLPAGLLRKFPDNNLQLMVQSGAKGSTVNTMQISCLLGQIELEGRRPPLMASGKSLPSFHRLETAPRAGGFIDGRFLTGIRPQEFFFHCMAGREGLIDTAVKTSRSGYLQRCLVKHLEGLTVNYDQTVRDSDGTVVQFYYGEDGLDVTKAQFLTPKQMPFLIENALAIICKSELLDETTPDEVLNQRRKIAKWREKNDGRRQRRRSPFAAFSAKAADGLDEDAFRKIVKRTGRPMAYKLMSEMWRDADAKLRQRYIKKEVRCPDPVTSIFQSDRDFGTLTEHIEDLMRGYLDTTIGPTLREDAAGSDVDDDELARRKEYVAVAVLFRDIMCHKLSKSVSPAGEPVGMLAAQSIGEPSTQMTLNTFHFAGRGEMNVTLGIPRLREILMVASKSMKTPSMDVPFLGVRNLEARADHLRMKISRVVLSDVLEFVTATYRLQKEAPRKQVYQLKLHFLPYVMYKEQHYVTPDSVLRFVETSFVTDLVNAIRKMEKAATVALRAETESPREKRRGGDDDDDEGDVDDPKARGGRKPGRGRGPASSDEEASDADDDATTARTRARHNDEYEDGDEEDDVPEEEDDGDEASDSDKPPDAAAQTNGTAEQTSGRESTSGIKEKSPRRRSKKGSDEEYAERRNNMINSSSFVLDYEFDRKDGEWCSIELGFSLDLKRLDLSSIVREVAGNGILWEVPLIKKAFTYENADTKELTLKTDGINIAEMYKHHELLDLDRLYTNDIHGMADIYGIEAARRVIVKEVQDVFKMYGITVDPRHLLLIADYMTFNGRFEPLSRTGMDKNVSPLQQMSFESSLTFLKQAAAAGKRDNLRSPSSRVMLGRPCYSGTGVFAVIQGFKKPPPPPRHHGRGVCKAEQGQKGRNVKGEAFGELTYSQY